MRFRIAVVGGPCGPYIDRCLDSLESQTDRGWSAAVVLDAVDDAPERALSKVDDRMTVAVNIAAHDGALANIVRAVRLMDPDPDDVVVTVDGDDWLNGPRVLERVRRVYEGSPEVVLTYGSWVGYPDPMAVNNSAPYQRAEFDAGALRQGPWRGSHLRTFRHKVWRRVRDEDLRDGNGKYYRTAWDLSFMWPMLEMAGYDRVRWMGEQLYVYNRETPHNDEKERSEEQQASHREIMAKPPYERVESW